MASCAYTTAGAFSFTAAVTGVHTIRVWGSGGAGGGLDGNADGGGGGGGGAFAQCQVTLVALDSYDVCVGAGGTPVVGASGGSGACSWFWTATCVMAMGGAGGCTSLGAGGCGGAGGQATDSIGDVRYNGGYGEHGRDSNAGNGGYGGSSAGIAAAGIDTTSQTFSTITFPAGSEPTGAGVGGNGGGTNTDGSAPASGNGGGGGGGGECNTAPGTIGGAGAAGMVCVIEPESPFVPTIDWF